MSDDSETPKRRSLVELTREMRFPGADHPIFKNPTVIGTRADLMRHGRASHDEADETSVREKKTHPRH